MKTFFSLLLFFFAYSLPAIAQPGNPPALRLLIPPIESPTRMYSRFKPLADYLSHRTGKSIRLVLSKNLEDFTTKAREEVPQIVYFCPLNYVKLAHEMRYYPLAGLALKGGGERSVILVRHDSLIRHLNDLKGKTFALGNTTCAASYLIPRTMLLHAGISMDDFIEVRNAGSDQAALMAVAARLYDATASGEDTAAPFIDKGILRPIAYSAAAPSDLIAATAQVAPDTRAQITQALLNLNTPKYQAITKAIKDTAHGFVPVQDSEYEIIRIMQRRITGEQLQSKAMPRGYSLNAMPQPPRPYPSAKRSLA